MLWVWCDKCFCWLWPTLLMPHYTWSKCRVYRYFHLSQLVCLEVVEEHILKQHFSYGHLLTSKTISTKNFNFHSFINIQSTVTFKGFTTPRRFICFIKFTFLTTIFKKYFVSLILKANLKNIKIDMVSSV